MKQVMIEFEELPCLWQAMISRGDFNYTEKCIGQFVEWVLEREEIEVLGDIPLHEEPSRKTDRLWYFEHWSTGLFPQYRLDKGQIEKWKKDNPWYIQYYEYWQEVSNKKRTARREEAEQRERFLDSIKKPLDKLKNQLDRAQQKGDTEKAEQIKEGIQELKNGKPMEEVNAIVAGINKRVGVAKVNHVKSQLQDDLSMLGV